MTVSISLSLSIMGKFLVNFRQVRASYTDADCFRGPHGGAEVATTSVPVAGAICQFVQRERGAATRVRCRHGRETGEWICQQTPGDGCILVLSTSLQVSLINQNNLKLQPSFHNVRLTSLIPENVFSVT